MIEAITSAVRAKNVRWRHQYVAALDRAVKVAAA